MGVVTSSSDQPTYLPPFRNQQEFVETMSLALQDLCQGGLLGNSEMVLWYAFREVGNDDLLAGRYQFLPPAFEFLH